MSSASRASSIRSSRPIEHLLTSMLGYELERAGISGFVFPEGCQLDDLGFCLERSLNFDRKKRSETGPQIGLVRLFPAGSASVDDVVTHVQSYLDEAEAKQEAEARRTREQNKGASGPVDDSGDREGSDDHDSDGSGPGGPGGLRFGRPTTRFGGPGGPIFGGGPSDGHIATLGRVLRDSDAGYGSVFRVPDAELASTRFGELPTRGMPLMPLPPGGGFAFGGGSRPPRAGPGFLFGGRGGTFISSPPVPPQAYTFSGGAPGPPAAGGSLFGSDDDF